MQSGPKSVFLTIVDFRDKAKNSNRFLDSPPRNQSSALRATRRIFDPEWWERIQTKSDVFTTSQAASGRRSEIEAGGANRGIS